MSSQGDAATIAVVSDFNCDLLAGYIANDPEPPPLRPVIAPFGQVMQILTNTAAPYWVPQPEATLVWTRPEGVSAGFAALLDGQTVDLRQVLDEVDGFARAVERAAGCTRWMLVSSWVVPSTRVFGLVDMRPGVGISGTLLAMNLRLVEQLDPRKAIVLNAKRWMDGPATEIFNPKRWYTGKIAFGNHVFREAARDVKAALSGLNGKGRKLILLDLDDTLWGGTVGDDGWPRLLLGGHDPLGEAFVGFQGALRSLKNRGVLLGIVSKNTEEVALEAIRAHPEMVLKPEDFAGWRINWQDKAQNVIDLVNELNLGMDSVVFIDDSPFERARLREALPTLVVPEWPADPMLYRSAILNLPYFEAANVSSEDARRTSLYADEGQRTALRRTAGSIDEWLTSLDMRVRVETLSDRNLARVVQLLNKTNQMNLRTRRMSEAELLAWSQSGNNRIWAFHVSDRLGSSGLTGILGLRRQDETAVVEDFVLSCRVMGRRIEEALVHVAAREARLLGATRLAARYVATAKNAPCLDFFHRSGLEFDASNSTFYWDLATVYPAPACLTLS